MTRTASANGIPSSPLGAEERLARAATQICGYYEDRLDASRNPFSKIWNLLNLTVAVATRRMIIQALRRLDSPSAFVRGWAYVMIATVGRWAVGTVEESKEDEKDPTSSGSAAASPELRRASKEEVLTTASKAVPPAGASKKKTDDLPRMSAAKLKGSLTGHSFAGGISFEEATPSMILRVAGRAWRLWIATADNPADIESTHVSDPVTDVIRHTASIEFANPEFSVRIPAKRFEDYAMALQKETRDILLPDVVLVSIAGMRVRTVKAELLPANAA